MDFSNPETWVRIGLLLFFGLLVVLKVPGAIVKALDAKTQAIKAEMDEALRIRQEAQELLNSLK
ncbi:MAG: ATP F0F1 synthase subunit B, partial [Asticcacaulis sp.]